MAEKQRNIDILKFVILILTSSQFTPIVFAHDGPSEGITAKSKYPFRAVTAAVPNMEIARQFAKGLIEEKLAATVNIIPNMISTYFWKGEFREVNEVLLLINTHERVYEKMEEYIKKHHVHVEPGVVAFPITDGSKSFFKWFTDTLEIEKTVSPEKIQSHTASILAHSAVANNSKIVSQNSNIAGTT